MRRWRGCRERTCQCRMRPTSKSWLCPRSPRWSRPPKPCRTGKVHGWSQRTATAARRHRSRRRDRSVARVRRRRRALDRVSARVRGAGYVGLAAGRYRPSRRARLCPRGRIHRRRGAGAHRRDVRSRNQSADRHGLHHAPVATRSLTMPINILMPALSPTMEKGNLAKWLKKEGDKVKSGDVIAEIETDKATMEVEAVDEGTIAKILVPEGTQDVPVNDIIAVLAGDGEDVKAASAGAGAAPAPKAAEAPKPAPAAAPAAPAPKPAVPAPAAAPQAAAAPAAQANGHARVFSSPLARRLAKEAGIEIGRITGSGPHGRIVARDVADAKSG